MRTKQIRRSASFMRSPSAPTTTTSNTALVLVLALCCSLISISTPFSFQNGLLVTHVKVSKRRYHHHHHRRWSNVNIGVSSGIVRRPYPYYYSSSLLFSSSSATNSIWEDIARYVYPEEVTRDNVVLNRSYADTVTLLRVGVPAVFLGLSAGVAYPPVCEQLAAEITALGSPAAEGVLAVVGNDAAQYIQNILTTSGLTFSILVGQTYYFMYQQQEQIYLALFQEVSTAKSLLEQVALVSQGRPELYRRMLGCVQDYVTGDLTQFNDLEGAAQVVSNSDSDSDSDSDSSDSNYYYTKDPLEEILFLTSVGEPSVVYQTVRALRLDRAARLGALQRKLPALHYVLLWTLAVVVLFTFPLLGAGAQSVAGGGPAILTVQSWYVGLLVTAVALTLGVVNELRVPTQLTAYNAKVVVLDVMVKGLREELDLRLSGVIMKPSIIVTTDEELE